MMRNKQIRLAQRPTGLPKESDWNLTTEEVGSIKDGQLLIEVEYISLDPAMRGWMNDAKSYIAPVAIGEVMRAGGVGKVIASKSEGIKEGDYVSGITGVQQYAIVDGKSVHKVDSKLLPLTTYLGVLGMPGLTAYFGLLKTGEPKEGETVVVSAASGAVGSVVGQIAKIKGCRVVGIAGGKDKCNYIVKELGFDGAIDYKNENIYEGLKRECSKGVDVYFDNVGGEILDAVLTRINFKARIVLCGAISIYNNTTPPEGLKNYLSLLVNRAKIEGIIVFDNSKHYAEAFREMAQWIREGKLKFKEDVYEGIENFNSILLKLFSGDKMGKLVLKIKE